MGLPGHRRTSSHKRRRASHFALEKPPISQTKAGVLHLGHRAAPGATEYNGHPIHVKGKDQKLEKMLKKSGAKHAHDEHDGHNH